MGTITITVDAGAGGQMTKTFTVTNANLGRLANWAKTMRGLGEGPELTNEQALDRWAQWVFDMTKAHLMEDERRKAAIADFS